MQHTECTPAVNWLEESFELEGATLGGGSLLAKGTPIVLLHGVTRQWRDYVGVMPAHAAYGPVTALDHRGHGSSSRGHARYRVSDFVEDAVAWIAKQTSGPVILMGHSLGAMTAAMVAARVPDQVLAVVLEDPPGTYLGERIAESRYWLQFNGLRDLLRHHTWADADALSIALAEMPVQHPLDGCVVPWSTLRAPKALQFAANCLLKMDPAVLDDLLAGRWLEGLDWFGELSHIRCPALLLRSDPDRGGMLIESEAKLIQSLIANCQRVDSPGHEHNLHGTDSSRYLDLVARFLQSHLPTTSPP